MNIKLHIRRAFINDDFHYLTVVKGVDDSDNLPPNVSTFKKDRGIQLEAATEEEDADDRQGDGVCDDQDQKFTQPIHETTNIVNTAYPRQWDGEDATCLSTAVEEQNHG